MSEEKKEEKKEEKREKVKINDFDLNEYIDQYKSHARISHLLFVSQVAEGYEAKAFNMLNEELIKGGDAKLYKQVCDKAGKQADAKWMQDLEKDAAVTKERLDSELNIAKTNLVKEDIRVAHNALGDFYYNRNDLSSALKCYVRTRDYCSSSQHIIDMCLNVIRVAIEMQNYSHVLNYVSKAEQTPDLSAQPKVVAKLRIASGLSHLQNRKYKQAARAFLDASVELGGNNYNEVVSQADVGLYGGICALAQFDRGELKRMVINNSRFKYFLDLVPDVNNLINAFYNCKYTEALQHLEKIKPRLLIDMYMAEHVHLLCRQIRNKAIVQFFYPYSSVDMKFMATAFNTTVKDLELELKNLIVEDAIQARIDSFNQVLVAKKTDQRTQMFKGATEVGTTYQDNTKDMLLRMDLVMHDFSVKPIRSNKKKA